MKPFFTSSLQPTIQALVTTPPPAPFPTWNLTVTRFSITPYPTSNAGSMPEPTPSCNDNTPGWVDLEGDGCDWYENNDLPGCPYWGEYSADIEGSTGVANDNCCFCKL